MSSKVIVILAEGFEEIEAITIIDILRRADINVTVANIDSKEIKGAHNVSVITDKDLSEAKSGFDACILPGGVGGAERLATSIDVGLLIKKMHRDGKIIAAICAAPAIVLAPLGILENRTATCYPDMESLFPRSASYKKDAVITDNNIITSRGPATAMLFSLAIVEKLCGKEKSETLKKELLLSE